MKIKPLFLFASALFLSGSARVAHAQAVPPNLPVPAQVPSLVPAPPYEPIQEELPPPPFADQPNGQPSTDAVAPQPRSAWNPGGVHAGMHPRLQKEFRPRFGIGASPLQGQSMWSDNGGMYAQNGLMLQLLLRASQRVELELSASWVDAYYSSFMLHSPFRQNESTVRGGMRIHPCVTLCRSVSPYIAFAAGINWFQGRQTTWFEGRYTASPVASVALMDMLYARGELGAGLEFRLGRKMSISADVRAIGEQALKNPENRWVFPGITERRAGVQAVLAFAAYF